MHLKNVIEIFSGIIQYYRSPKKRNSWGGPFNNQEFRRKIFKQLIDNFPFSGIVETGTYRGTTTEHFRKTSGLPVYTVESHPRFYGFSIMRFLFKPEVKVKLNDSRAFLKDLTKMPELKNKLLFFYLDAHWESDLPLAKEVDIIYRHWPDAVVMVDDFQVPFDKGYQYDDYGENKSLTSTYLNNNLKVIVERFFPSQPSESETGAKRGCIILSHSGETGKKLKTLDTLRQSD